MKKILLVFAFVAMTLGLSAQTSQGTLLITGGFGFTTSSPSVTNTSGSQTTTFDLPSRTVFGLNVLGGYFIADNLAVGMGLGFDFDKTTEKEEDWTYDEILSVFTIAPTFRYYMPAGEKLSFYGDFGVGLGFGSYKEVYKEGSLTFTDEFSISEISIGIRPGLNYMLSKTLALEIRYGFLGFESETRTLNDVDETIKVNTPVVGLNLNLNTLRFGLTFLI